MSATGRRKSIPEHVDAAIRKALEKLPAEIESLEEALAEVNERLADPELYRSRGDEVPGLTRRRDELNDRVAEVYARWEELEERRESS